MDAVLAGRGARSARDLRAGVRRALPRGGGARRARRAAPAPHRPGGRAVAQDADDALRDRASVDHVQGSVQRPLAAGPRRRRPQLEPVHRDHAQHQRRGDGGLQSRIGQPGAARRRRTPRRGGAGRHRDAGDADARQRRRHQLLPDARGAHVEPAPPSGGPRPHGLAGCVVRPRSAVRRAGGGGARRPHDGGDLVPRHPGLVAAGRGARAVRVVCRLEVGSRPPAVRHAGPARRRARHAGRREPDAAARLGAGLRQRRRARHAQLEHDGHRPDRDHRQHRRLLSLHRADLPQHLRQGQHQRRVHDRQRAPGARSQGARAVERRHARPPEVLRRQPADDRRRAGPLEGEVPRDVRDRSDRRAAGDGGARQVDRSEPGAHGLHEGRLGAQAERGLPDGVAPRPQDHLLPAHPRGLAGREVDAGRRPLRLHPDTRVRGARRRSPTAALCRIDDPDCESCQ